MSYEIWSLGHPGKLALLAQLAPSEAERLVQLGCRRIKTLSGMDDALARDWFLEFTRQRYPDVVEQHVDEQHLGQEFEAAVFD